VTENHGYNTPREGATDWHIPLNENFEQIDRDVEIRDTEAKRSEYAPRAGAKFLATDTENEYLGDGSEWQKLATSGKSPSFDSVETRELRQTTDGGGTRRELLDTASSEDRLDHDTGELPAFDAYEVNFSVDGGLSCRVNDVDHNQRYEAVLKTSGELAAHLSDDSERPTGVRRETGSNWNVFNGVGSGTLLVHGPNQAGEDGTFVETTATVSVTNSPSATVLESGVVTSDDPVRRLRLSGSGGKLNVYGVDFVR
jgi:hypothetical protein